MDPVGPFVPDTVNRTPEVTAPVSTLNEETRRFVHEAFEERIPFNRFLKFRIVDLDPDGSSLTFENRPEFVGNFVTGSLHGGVASSALDTVGGLAALVGALREHQRREGELPPGEIRDRMAKIGTIDLRVDYLRPATGDRFTARGRVLRTGRRVVVTRMELADGEGERVCVGTGTYIVA